MGYQQPRDGASKQCSGQQPQCSAYVHAFDIVMAKVSLRLHLHM
jgi:hypothetical protein